MLAVLGVSFLTPLDALFVLAAAVPLVALMLPERRAEQIRRLLRCRPGTPALVPIVDGARSAARARRRRGRAAGRRSRADGERARRRTGVRALRHVALDARSCRTGPADTARAREAPGAAPAANALGRADGHRIDDRPLAPESHADDRSHTVRAHGRAVDRGQPTAAEPGVQDGRATTFDALIPLVESHLFSQGVQRRLLVVFTDGESSTDLAPAPADAPAQGDARLRPRLAAGRADLQGSQGRPTLRRRPREQASARRRPEITGATQILRGARLRRVLARRPRRGRARGTRTHIDSYARIALAPWFVLGGACRSRSCSGGGTPREPGTCGDVLERLPEALITRDAVTVNAHGARCRRE